MNDTTKKKITTISRAISKRVSDINPKILVTSDYIANKYGDGLLDTSAIANILRVKEDTVIVMISTHRMPFNVTRIGNQWFTTAYDVAEYVVNNHQKRDEYKKTG
jgi:hypothetical protein